LHGEKQVSERAVTLRDVREEDLPIFCEQQMDPIGIQMAAFTPDLPNDTAAYMARLRKLVADESVTQKAILFDGQVIGSIASFGTPEEREVTYWLGRQYWGKGLASWALAQFIELCGRPLYARAAKDNLGSIRVLEKCGFIRIGEETSFANARRREIEEVIYRLM
jgi:RimJ/RimL family protein N-acetyltransferase